MISDADKEVVIRIGWITASLAAELFDIDASTIRRWAYRGLIRRIRGSDGVHRYSLEDIQDVERKRRAH